MLANYNFNLVLQLMNSKYRETTNSTKLMPNGLRYFARLEQIFALAHLDKRDSRQTLAYLSKN